MTDQEINEVVARKLGWIIDKTSDFLPWYGRPNGRPESAMVRELPDYCHSIAAAWEIVEKYPKGYFLLMKVKGDIFWKCDIGNEGAICVVEADTAPMAICLEFLRLP